jgi:hypothetical protein
MEWLCNCGKPVTTLELLWQWRDAAAIGHRHGRHICYRCRIGCEDCVPKQGDNDYQYFPVRLTAGTKQGLRDQILAKIIGQGLRGYLPRADLQRALRNVHKGP